MKDTLTDDEVDRILSGKKRTIKINGIWDFKKEHLGRIALFNRSGNMRIPMPHLIANANESEEFKCALKIIKQIQAVIDLTKE